MKIKNTLIIFFTMILVLSLIGIVQKKSYRDFNEEEHPLNNFSVGLLSDGYLDICINNARNNLEKSLYIVEAECVDETEFRYSCTLQKVVIKKNYGKMTIEEGQTVYIARDGNCIFWDDDINVGEKKPINMGFVNEMKVGDKYLIFMDRKKETKDGEEIYITSAGCGFATIFSYKDYNSIASSSIDDLANTVYYEDVSDSEYFLMSDESIYKMNCFKNEILELYK